MPNLEEAARNQRLQHQFLTGQPALVASQLKVTCETKELDTTVEKARPLIAVEKSMRQALSHTAQDCTWDKH